ncbi:hypothetical protein Maes01_01620 [Microbulbifer aestuariivivens]|uniref:VWFA domain-containing protein n=1 Tax=Microbulbifer aestuariivivens TaxID=1908308 RepID=A0ABP9WPQ2_9GAMM
MNNKLLKKMAPKPLLLGLLGFGITLSTCVSAQEAEEVFFAEPLALSNTPLQATGRIEPNLMILIDNSGSMDEKLASGEKRMKVAQDAAKEVIDGLSGMRVGLAQFDNRSPYDRGGQILQGLTSLSEPNARDNLKSKIDNIEPETWTPLGKAMGMLGRYFVEGYEGKKVTIHPGHATKEERVNAGSVLPLKPYYGSVAEPTSSSPVIQQYCQSNFIIAMTDGEPAHDKSVSTYIDNYDLDGNSDDEDALDDIAKALYEIDWRPDLEDPDNPNHKNNIISHFIGFADKKLKDNQLLKDAGAQGGGSYQFAENAEELAQSLNLAVNSITSSIGSQSSVSFSSTSLKEQKVIYMAKFDTSDFSGQLYAKSLDLMTGVVAEDEEAFWEASEQLAGETSDSREIITYLNGKGVPFTVTGLTPVSEKNNNKKKKKKKKDDKDEGDAEDTAQAQDLMMLDTDGEPDELWVERLEYIRGSTAYDNLDEDDDEYEGDFRRRSRISSSNGVMGSKLLGDIVHSTPIYVGKPDEDWPSRWGGNQSADFYQQYKRDNVNRNPMVYVGANDGMLHGFRADTGEEVFAYVPSLVLDTSRYKGLHSFTHKDYPHNYYVDLTPTVSDIYIDPAGGSQQQWMTVLVGGLRGGGKGYFALDISAAGTTEKTDNGIRTTPDRFDEAFADEMVLWEFDGAADAANLGYSYSEVEIAKLNNGKWAAIFGNGYNSDNGVAGLFIVYIEEGADGSWDVNDYKFISTGRGQLDSRKNGLSAPALLDMDGDHIVDRVYAGDLMGNMWSFDLSAKTDNQWGIYGNKPLFSAGDEAGMRHVSILSAPAIAKNNGKGAGAGAGANVLVLFGTGQYLNNGDLTDENPGAFYAVLDDGSTMLGNSIVAADLAERMFTEDDLMAPTEFSVDSRVRQIDAQSTEVDWEIHKGWRLALTRGEISDTGFAGERVVTEPSVGFDDVARSYTVFFSTIIPNPQPCASSGTGYIMSLDVLSGGAPSLVSDFNNDGEVDSHDKGYIGEQFVACAGYCLEGKGKSEDPGMPGKSAFIENRRCTPGSAGVVICDEVIPLEDEGPGWMLMRKGIMSWEEVSPR